MKLLTLKQMSIRQSDVVFKQPSFGLLIVASISWGAFIAGIYCAVAGHIGSFDPPRLLAIFESLFALLFAWLSTGSFRASLHPSNWLMRIRGNDIFIKFRSYANWRLSEDDPQVIQLHRDEIASVRQRQERTVSQQMSGHGVQAQTQNDLEITLNDPDTSELEKALAEERGRPGWGNDRHRSKTLDYPVQADAGVIRVTWQGKGSSTKPKIKRALQELHRIVKVDEMTAESQDLTSRSLRQLPAEEQHRKLIELAQTSRITAIETARSLYKCSLADAGKMIDDLTAEG